MFKISFIVEDKHLAKVLHSVTGVALNLETRPVGNATMVQGKVVQQTESGHPYDVVANKLLSMQGAHLTGIQIKELIRQSGGTDTASGYYLKKLKEQKVLKSRSRGNYIVMASKQEVSVYVSYIVHC